MLGRATLGAKRRLKLPPRIESGDQVSLISYSAEGRALSVPNKLGGSVNLADVGAVSSKLLIWRTGFRYSQQAVVGFGTGILEAGSIFFGACVSFITLSDQFLTSPDDAKPLETDFKNTMPRDTEAFILLDGNGTSSQNPCNMETW